ncbi:MAG: pyridoxal phosphate-dependent aminotransferase [Bacteroidales bacterium]|nr:pyridoxal phosphate-dependent aminotransferase [Bacteroidales bacterium]MBR2887705.1 pyridoxal phosphate-dependent aminotransferase [Bacteroidales bacterium]MDD6000877.1 pyridoxal phosphate-dependent aminotransferase [Bacteroidales bacterium]
MRLSSRINRVAESQTLAMSQKSNELKEQGIDVVNLTVGQPDFFTPDNVKEAAKKAIDENYSFYSPVPGYKDLIKAIQGKFKRENNLEYAENQIVVSTGAKQCLANAMQCLFQEGDEVIIPTPYWVSYIELAHLCNAKPVIIEGKPENYYKITPEQLEKAITPKTHGFILNAPSNPSGSIYTKDELKALADVLAKYPEIAIISDEIYEHLNYVGKHESIAQFANVYNQTIVINGLSKAYAMTGWRLGYMAGPVEVAKACKKLQGQTTSGTCSITQRAAIEALNGDQSIIAKNNEVLVKRRDLMVKYLHEIPGVKLNVPPATFYTFPDFSAYYGKSYNGKVIKGSDDLCDFLLNVAHVATVAGSAFGVDACIRMSYVVDFPRIDEAFKRINKALALLK